MDLIIIPASETLRGGILGSSFLIRKTQMMMHFPGQIGIGMV
jgi:hypothetical protein